MTLDPDAIGSREDRTDIIASVTREQDNGVEFQLLCDASQHFGDLNNAEFRDACRSWLAGFRSKIPVL